MDPLQIAHLIKGDLISEFFSLWLKSSKKGAKSLSWVLSTQREDVYDIELALFLDLSQNEKLSEIRPPLVDLLALKKKGLKPVEVW